MFSVVFEVHPHKTTYDAYLETAKSLRPDLERMDGFVDNVRYKSLIREGWILSLSDWRDEKSVVRWRSQSKHHDAQDAGRTEIFEDYNLRVGQVTADNQLPNGQSLVQQRFDNSEIGQGTAVTIITAKRPKEWKNIDNAYDCAEWLGLDPRAASETSWDVYEAMLTPGDLLLMIVWDDEEAAKAYEGSVPLPEGARLRRVRIVRNYGKYDRREAPQFFPDTRDGSDASNASPSRRPAAAASPSSAAQSQAAAGGDAGNSPITVRAGEAEFPVGRGGSASPGATPYDLLSASLAACTAMTLRHIAERKKYPLSRVDVSVSYRHGDADGADYFDRTIVLKGELTPAQKQGLLKAADYCPVGETLGRTTSIRTREAGESASVAAPADYSTDLEELSIPNIDPD